MSKKESIFLIAIFLAAMALRVYKLDVYPAGLHGDEAWTGIEAQRILKDGHIGWWSDSSYGNPALVFYGVAGLFKLLGASVFSVRLGLALLNIAWIPFFYLFVKEVSSQKLAFWSTWLLATGYAALAFSRKAELLALNFALFPALCFFLRGMRTKKAWHFVASGIFCGLAMHTNQPFWLTFPAVSILFVVMTLVRRRLEWKFGYTILFFLVFGWPILSLLVKPNSVGMARFRAIVVTSAESKDQTLDGQNDEIRQSIMNTLLMFNLRRDLDDRNYFYPGPVLDPISGALMLIGLVAGVWYSRKHPQFLIVYFIWILFLTGSALTVNSPNTRRSQPSVYVAYIFAALPVVLLMDYLGRDNSKSRKIAIVLAGMVIVGIGVVNIRIYFKYSVSPAARGIMAYQLTQASDYITSLPVSTYIYFYSSRWSYDYETTRFLLAGYRGENRSREFGEFSLVTDRRPAVLILLPEYLQNQAEIVRQNPGGQWRVWYDPDGEVSLATYLLSI